jgi:hypothetical protein
MDAKTAPPPAAPDVREKPAWLAALDGLCQPCADARFYGLRKWHDHCQHGDCACTYVIPIVWPAGTWPV